MPDAKEQVLISILFCEGSLTFIHVLHCRCVRGRGQKLCLLHAYNIEIFITWFVLLIIL